MLPHVRHVGLISSMRDFENLAEETTSIKNMRC
jgi:hypothetical protein